MQFSISADTIKALLLAAPKNDVRYYLNGIFFDVRATDAVAVTTNGHILLAVPLTVENETTLIAGQYIVPRECLDNIKRNKYDVPLQFTFTGDSVTVNNCGTIVTSKLLDGRYPEWRRVVPRTVSDDVAQFNSEYVGTFGKMHKLLGGLEWPVIRHNGANNSARVVLSGDAVGVIMPMRHDIQPLDNPAWLDTLPAPVSAAA